MFHDPVVPVQSVASEQTFHAALVAGLARVAAKIGRGNLADKSGRTTRALDKVFCGDNCGKHYKALTDFLLADPSALDEVLALYGFGLHRLAAGGPDDFGAIADSAALAAEHTEAMRDGVRDHRETLRIAEKARPVLKAYSGIVAEADRIRGVAA